MWDWELKRSVYYPIPEKWNVCFFVLVFVLSIFPAVLCLFIFYSWLFQFFYLFFQADTHSMNVKNTDKFAWIVFLLLLLFFLDPFTLFMPTIKFAKQTLTQITGITLDTIRRRKRELTNTRTHTAHTKYISKWTK